jgi:hypothetical protein
LNSLRLQRGKSITFDDGRWIAAPDKALFDKYGTPFFAFCSFFIEGSSSVSAASAIVSNSSFRLILDFVRASPLGAGACTAVVDEGDQIIQTAHGTLSLKISFAKAAAFAFRFINLEKIK